MSFTSTFYLNTHPWSYVRIHFKSTQIPKMYFKITTKGIFSIVIIIRSEREEQV